MARQLSPKLRLQRTIGGQFGRPSGLLGGVIARLMARGHAPLNAWIVDRLRIEPTNWILEVGFGPSVTLAEFLARAPDGAVVGVDVSALMVRRARARHADAIAAGSLQLHEGDATSLPFEDASFDVVYGAHVVYFWPDQVATVRELRRVLRPGGTLALGYQEREHLPPAMVAGLERAGAKPVGRGDVEAIVRAAGFADVRAETLGDPVRPDGCCILARKERRAG